MNTPPTDFIRVAPEPMRAFVTTVFQKGGLSEDHAGLLANLLVRNDLRGVFSHGTGQVAGYVDHFQSGRLNPRPQVQVVTDEGPTAVVDGDGGLGYFPAWRAVHLVAQKCREHGLAAAVTRNHGHIGAAGIYSRVPLAQNQIGYVTSGHQLELRPHHSILSAAGGSPMSFAIPAGSEPPFVLDFGAMHDLYAGSPNLEEVLRLAPSTVFRSFGLGCVCQAIGGFLGGVPISTGTGEPPETTRRWSGANQGAFIAAFDINRFMPLEQFTAQMEAFVRCTREMQPATGYDKAALAGSLEWEREREWSQTGIPVGRRHRESLTKVGEALGVPLPF